MNATGFDPEQGFQQLMQLMVSQIRYQDPLNPVSPEDTTAQLAQISTVSGINELNVQFEEFLQLQSLFSEVNLVGQQVEYLSPTAGEIETGKIMEARVEGEKFSLSVNGEQISLSDIRAVMAESESA